MTTMTETPARTISYQDTLALLKRAVDEKGEEHTVGACRYFDPETGQPECIVGHVLSYLGVEVTDIHPVSTTDKRTGVKQNGSRVAGLQFTGIKFTGPAMQLLNIAQTQQDNHITIDHDNTWGTAYSYAESQAKRFDESGLYV